MGALDSVSIGWRCRTVRAFTVEPRGAGPELFEQVSDVGLDPLQGLAGQRSPFDGKDAAVWDSGSLGAAADQGCVQVARSEERVRSAAEFLAEVVEGDQVVADGEDGVGAKVRS
jgi:hypothetical protein